MRKIDNTGGMASVIEYTVRDLTPVGKRQPTRKSRISTKSDFVNDLRISSSERIDGSPGSSDYRVGINSSYCFELGKRGSDKSWLLDKLHVTDLPDVDTKQLGFKVSARRPSRKPLGELVIDGLAQEDINIARLETRPETTIIDIKINTSGLPVVAFEYGLGVELGSSVVGKMKPRVRSELTLDPAHFYQPVKLEQTCDAGVTLYTFSNDWIYEFEGELPKRIASTQLTKIMTGSTTNKIVEQVQVSERQYGPIPAREFTLSAFGFPEPPGLPERDTGWPTYVYALLVAGVAAVILVAIRLRKSRS